MVTLVLRDLERPTSNNMLKLRKSERQIMCCYQQKTQFSSVFHFLNSTTYNLSITRQAYI